MYGYSELEECISKIDADIAKPEMSDKADFAFHQKLLESCGNRAFLASLTILKALFKTDCRKKNWQPELFKRAVDEHRKILSAIIAGKTEDAVNLMQHHLSNDGN